MSGQTEKNHEKSQDNQPLICYFEPGAWNSSQGITILLACMEAKTWIIHILGRNSYVELSTTSTVNKYYINFWVILSGTDGTSWRTTAT
jgi:hypothetical protein